MPTKEELENENAELRARVDELETAQASSDYAETTVAGSDGAPATPAKRPDYLSAGELNDLEQYGVTVSPFNGETLTATREGVEPLTDEARRRDRLETERLDRIGRTDVDAPLAAPGDDQA